MSTRKRKPETLSRAFLCPHLCSHKSAGHKKDNERCAFEGFLFIVQHSLQVRQSLRSKVGNPASATTRDPKTFCLRVLFFTELQVFIKYRLYLPWCVRSRFDTLLFSRSSLIQLERVLLIVFAIVSYLWILRIDWAFWVLAQFPWVLLDWYVRISSTCFR